MINKITDKGFKFSSIVNNVLKESLSRLAYHFTSLKKFYQMVDSDSIIFSTAHGTDELINADYGRGAPYYLSTTRVRDGRFGYSSGLNTRIELNSDFFNSRFHSGPVNFFVPDERERNYHSKQNVGKAENEDRIFSNVKVLEGLSKCINRVDIYLNIPNEELPLFKQRYYDIYLMLRDIYNTGIGLKTFIYNDEKEFNRQGKNITEIILKML